MDNEANLVLETHMKELKLSFIKEFRFHPTRKWRFDYLLKNGRDAIEIEGGIWMGKGHTGGEHYQSDLEKYREAAKMGFRVYRFSTQDVLSGKAKEFLGGL
jgi:very-short-patch-repair endonuclease